MRNVIQEFNLYRVRVVVPGHQLVIDEMISPYEGMESIYSMEGMPGKVCIQRKPKGIGIELKALADGLSNIILQIEIQEGKEYMKDKQYMKQYGAGTSQCLRLTKPYCNSLRIVIGDAAFGSVKTLLALKDINQLYFIGCVKMAHREFPKKYLQSWYDRLDIKTDRGKHLLLKKKR